MKRLSTARYSQLIFLIIFIWLFIQTEYRGNDTISAAVNSFFRADPLVLASYVAAVKSFDFLLLPSLLMVLFTILLGRFFCGWICPLGTILDLVTVKIKKTAPIKLFKGNFKYWLLLPLLSSAFFNVNLAGILDPIAILVRALTFFLYPLIGDGFRTGWVGIYNLIGDKRDLLAPGYNILKDHLLPFRETFYPLAFLSAFIFALIIFIERYERRNWCRNLCPLGTLLGLLSRFSFFKRTPVSLCTDCKACRTTCPTAFDDEYLNKQDCILCMDCQHKCQQERVSFQLSPFPTRRDNFVPERRVLLGGLISGFMLSGIFRYRKPDAMAQILRPPGVRDEDLFLRKCVRCGECMKVCLKSALYPAVLQAGFEGLYTPMLIPRLGYCEYNCTLCGQVCPTAAIPNLSAEKKQLEVIGKAILNKSHCLPLARKINCIVCEEHCPIPQKAIRSRTEQQTDDNGLKVTIQVPFIVEELCNGCGICENVCPLEGKPGIEVFAVKNRSPIEIPVKGTINTLPPQKDNSNYGY